jgi:bacterioferritin-associated ferredoxin
MYVCVCNAIREADLREAAHSLPGDAEAVYAQLGKVPQCCQCLEEADELIAEERACNRRLTLGAA